MKKWWIVGALLFLTGCTGPNAFETVNDTYLEFTLPQQTVSLTLPQGAVQAVMGAQEGKIYLCDDYTVAVQTFSAGDLHNTLMSVTGFSREDLSVMELVQGDCNRYETVWTAAGEGDSQIGRAVILDDGCYHYTVSVMGPASTVTAWEEACREILRSVSLQPVHTDS